MKKAEKFAEITPNVFTLAHPVFLSEKSILQDFEESKRGSSFHADRHIVTDCRVTQFFPGLPKRVIYLPVQNRKIQVILLAWFKPVTQTPVNMALEWGCWEHVLGILYAILHWYLKPAFPRAGNVSAFHKFTRLQITAKARLEFQFCLVLFRGTKAPIAVGDWKESYQQKNTMEEKTPNKIWISLVKSLWSIKNQHCSNILEESNSVDTKLPLPSWVAMTEQKIRVLVSPEEEKSPKSQGFF